MECTSQINKRSIYHKRSPRFRLICYVLLLFQSHQTTSQVLPLSKYTRYPASGVSWLQFSLCAPFRSSFLRDNSHHQFPAQKLSVNPYCLLNAAQTLHLKFNILYNLVPSSFADQLPHFLTNTLHSGQTGWGYFLRPQLCLSRGTTLISVLASSASNELLCFSSLVRVWPPWSICSFEFLLVKFYPEFKYSLRGTSSTNVFWIFLSSLAYEFPSSKAPNRIWPNRAPPPHLYFAH